MIKVIGGTNDDPQYVWKLATLISKPQLPRQRCWIFRLEDGSMKPIHIAADGGSDEWLLSDYEVIESNEAVETTNLACPDGGLGW